MDRYRNLTEKEKNILEANGCTAEDWNQVQVVQNFTPDRITFTHFSGQVFLGAFGGKQVFDGINRACGIHHARLHNCKIGDNVLISQVGSIIANYHIEDDVLIEDTYLISAEAGANFGCGVQVSVLNEAGGREVTLFPNLNAQIAYLQAIYKHDPAFQQKLEALIAADTIPNQSGLIQRGAQIRHCGRIKNVHIGPMARLEGVAHLSNGTILSCDQDPTLIGHGVQIENFIIAEGAHIESSTTLENVYVGQATHLGKGLSAENALFFANCDGFNSEVNAIFAGPYSVTHHKSTLLIASLFSFYNAGSGTNQSNHMYKLGPVHQGIFERGSKTGSFSYVLLESHIGAFTTVIGKHLTNINTPTLPFSYIIESKGNSRLMPGLNLFSIGTVRDGAKWPARDRRKSPTRRDRIIFDVFSPYTMEKVRQGRSLLQKLYEETPREAEVVTYGGVQIPRLLLRKGTKYYNFAIDRYFIGKVMDKMEPLLTGQMDWAAVQKSLMVGERLQKVAEWLDIAGLIVAKERVEQLMADVTNGSITSMDALCQRLDQIYKEYEADEWAYVCYGFEQEFASAPFAISQSDFAKLLDRWERAAASLNNLQLDDARKEFGDFSQIGFGLGFEDEKAHDFSAVRGTIDTNAVIQKLLDEKNFIQQRAEKFRKFLAH